MRVSDAVNQALCYGKVKKVDLARHWGVSRATINMKFVRDSWFGHQLADIAQLTGGKLTFIYPDGTQIPIDPDPPQKDIPATPDAPADDSPGE